MLAIEGTNIGGGGRVQHIADCKDARCTRRQLSVNRRAACACVNLDAGSTGKLILGNPITGENHTVTFEDLGTAFRVLDLHTLDLLAAENLGDLC